MCVVREMRDSEDSITLWDFIERFLGPPHGEEGLHTGQCQESLRKGRVLAQRRGIWRALWAAIAEWANDGAKVGRFAGVSAGPRDSRHWCKCCVISTDTVSTRPQWYLDLGAE